MKCFVFACILCGPLTSYAADYSPPLMSGNIRVDIPNRIRSAIKEGVIKIEHAYGRRHIDLDGGLSQPIAASSMGELFPQYGFRPKEQFFSSSLQNLNQDESLLCVTATASSAAEWTGVTAGMQDAGLRSATSGCQGAAIFSVPTKFPVTLSGMKTLDRRDYPVTTTVPNYPSITGFIKTKKVQPAITFTAAPYTMSPPVTINIYNTPIIIQTKPELLFLKTIVAPISIREGFNIVHNCGLLDGGQACQVVLRYQGSSPLKSLVGLLRLEFSTGEVAVVSLRGKTTLN